MRTSDSSIAASRARRCPDSPRVLAEASGFTIEHGDATAELALRAVPGLFLLDEVHVANQQRHAVHNARAVVPWDRRPGPVVPGAM